MKLTQWFPSSIKPVHNGVYEVDASRNYFGKLLAFSKFTNGKWSMMKASIQSAGKETDLSSALNRKYEFFKWRGVTKETNEMPGPNVILDFHDYGTFGEGKK